MTSGVVSSMSESVSKIAPHCLLKRMPLRPSIISLVLRRRPTELFDLWQAAASNTSPIPSLSPSLLLLSTSFTLPAVNKAKKKAKGTGLKGSRSSQEPCCLLRELNFSEKPIWGCEASRRKKGEGGAFTQRAALPSSVPWLKRCDQVGDEHQNRSETKL